MTMMPTASAASIPSLSVMTSDSNMPGSALSAVPAPARRPRPHPALLAESLDLERVRDDREALPLAHPVLEPLDLVVREFDDLPAPQTDHVVVVPPAVHLFVAGVPLAGQDLLHQPAVHEMG